MDEDVGEPSPIMEWKTKTKMKNDEFQLNLKKLH
jgi:hypothetical protein